LDNNKLVFDCYVNDGNVHENARNDNYIQNYGHKAKHEGTAGIFIGHIHLHIIMERYLDWIREETNFKISIIGEWMWIEMINI
jgi:hypothetical protein